MTKEIVFPEFIGESDDALVLVLPTLKDELSEIMERFHAGEEISYSFSWQLLNVEADEYLIVLDIDWEDGTGIVVGFTTEMWEIFRYVTSKQHLVLMFDWELVMKGIPGGLTSEGEFKPQAFLIRDVSRGLGNLLEQAEELEPDEQQSDSVGYLFEVLGDLQKERYLLH